MSMADMLKGRTTLKSTNGPPAAPEAPRPPPPRGTAPPPPPPAGLGRKKTIGEIASRPMKTLQWDKVPPQLLVSSIWSGIMRAPNGNDVAGDESEWAKEFRREGIFDEIEENFGSKATVIRVIGSNSEKKALITELDQKQRQVIGESPNFSFSIDWLVYRQRLIRPSRH
jgi:hypothetical protein